MFETKAWSSTTGGGGVTYVSNHSFNPPYPSSWSSLSVYVHPVGLSGFVKISIDRGGTGDALNSSSSCAAVSFHWAVGSRSINRIFLLASRAMKKGTDEVVMMRVGVSVSMRQNGYLAN